MENQEPRTEQVAIAVTASEKEAIRLLAKIRKTDISNLLRTVGFPEALAEGQRLMAKLEELAGEAEAIRVPA